MKNLFTIFLLSNVLLLISSCADSIVENVESIDGNSNQNLVTPSFSVIQTNIFDKSCALSGCHINGVVSPNLSGNSYSAIVGKPSSKGINYIEPNDPENSYLLNKIIGQGISGSRMPIGAIPLSQSVVDSISTWISDGAKNN